MTRDTSSQAARGWRWAGYAGAAWLIFALFRASVNNGWDLWCTVTAALGVAGVGTWAVFERALLRERSRGRNVRYGGQVIAAAAMLAAALALVNFIAVRHNHSFDLTEAGFFTLSPETKQVVAGLKRDVEVLAFFPANRRAQPADVLRRYAELSPHFHYELIDLNDQPDVAQQYDVTAEGTVVVKVPKAPGEPAVSGKPIKIEPEENTGKTPTLSEEKLTNAIVRAARATSKTIYFLEGHKEADIANPEPSGYARVKTALEDQAFVVKPLFLPAKAQVPADCAVLVVAGPGKEPLPGELAAIRRYLEAGGKAMFLVDPSPGAGLESFLDRWGVRVGGDIVMDTSGAGRLYGAGPAMPLIKDYDGQQPITRNFRLMTFWPLTRSAAPKENSGDAVPWPLAQTSPDSFAEPYSGGERHLRFDAARDRKGPIVVATAVTRAAKEGREARLVVLGSSNLVTNHFFTREGNGDFFLNCVNWLAEQEGMIAIRPRSPQDRRIQMTEAQARGLFWLVVVVMPLAALAAGVVVHLRRR